MVTYVDIRKYTVKTISTFRVLSFLIAALIFSMSAITFAQQNLIETKAEIEAEARARAIIDAENDTNKTAWFMTGCFLNCIGVSIAQTTKAPVPAGRLVGKSLTYTVAYTSSYQTRRTEIQTAAAWGGVVACVVGCLVGVYLLGEAVDDATSTSSSGSSSRDSGGSSWCSPFF